MCYDLVKILLVDANRLCHNEQFGSSTIQANLDMLANSSTKSQINHQRSGDKRQAEIDSDKGYESCSGKRTIMRI